MGSRQIKRAGDSLFTFNHRSIYYRQNIAQKNKEASNPFGLLALNFQNWSG
jgi:hypothetical protein